MFPSKPTNRQSRSTNIQASYAHEPKHTADRRNPLSQGIISHKLASMGAAQRSRLLSDVGNPFTMNRREQEKFMRQAGMKKYK